MLIAVELTQVSCCSGCVYAIPTKLYRHMRAEGANHDYIYCPLGHRWHYLDESSESKIDKLKYEIQEKDNELARQREIQARLQRRALRGLCIFCKRSFVNVARHMACKHKDIELNSRTLIETRQ